jgi:FKBP-type peptidyl-prolyl cis-trans isomerase
MKRIFGSVLVLSSLLLNSCGKNDSGCQPNPVANEKPQLTAYCTANAINYSEHSSGLLYQIIDPGSGATPTSSSTVSVVYTGKFLTGTTFDATANPISLSLSSVIDGWKIGLPLISKGGRIKLIIPSALAYSCAGYPPAIAPNTPLYFDITLTDVK